MRYRRLFLPVILSIGICLISGCGPPSPPPSPTTGGLEPSEKGAEPAALQLTSAAFADGETIPEKYTCAGEDVSPPLSWGDPPEGTESFALIVDDPDAPMGTWVHWVLHNLPADWRSLPESVPAEDQLSDGALHGTNSWERRDYGGPCPPSGSTHRYVFKLFALNTKLDLKAGATKQQLLEAMEGHVLAQGQLIGRFGR